MAIATAGCSTKSGTCSRYASMEVECGGYSESDAESSRAMFKQMCLDSWEQPGSMHKAEAKCALKSPTCTDYEVCKERNGPEW